MIVVVPLALHGPLVTEYVRVCVPTPGLNVLPLTPVPLHVPPEGVPPNTMAASFAQSGP